MRLTSTQVDRLRAVLRRLKEEKFDGNETALAKAINVGQTTVFRFLSGKHGATMETAEKIAAYMGVGVAGLLGLDSKPPTQPAQIVSPAPPPVSETPVGWPIRRARRRPVGGLRRAVGGPVALGRPVGRVGRLLHPGMVPPWPG